MAAGAWQFQRELKVENAFPFCWIDFPVFYICLQFCKQCWNWFELSDSWLVVDVATQYGLSSINLMFDTYRWHSNFIFKSRIVQNYCVPLHNITQSWQYPNSNLYLYTSICFISSLLASLKCHLSFERHLAQFNLSMLLMV